MLSLVLPTFNESENIPELLPMLEEVLADVPHEIIIVDDDSPDKTWRVAQESSVEMDHVHVIRRIGRSGLSSAVIEGFLAAKGSVLAVMDADGQHDMSLLPRLYSSVVESKGMAIGSRYVEGGSVGEWDEQRFRLSRIATQLAKKLCRVRVQDPMSGFFAIDAILFSGIVKHLNPKGFKILLDILVNVPSNTPAQELPFTFSSRLHGDSKLTWTVQVQFLEYLYDVTIGRYIPLTFLKYCIVGSLGVIVHICAYLMASHLMTLSYGQELQLQGFSIAVLIAIEVAVIFNFLLNNVWTFSHQRLRGLEAVKGFVTFNAACSVGALANYGVSSFLFSRGIYDLLSVIIGAFVGVFWNYTMNRLMTWRQ